MGIPAILYPTKMSHVSFWDICVADDAYSQSIATVHPNSSCGFSAADAEGFARLIAAAPDLLEALKAAKEFHDRDSGLNAFTADYECLRLQIDEAIAKAEGRS